MSILVYTNTQQEEKILLAFLDSLHFRYQLDIGDNAEQISKTLLDQYKKEIEATDFEIECGNFATHKKVEELFQKRRKAL